MKIAYLVLAHNTPKHLMRLIKALSSARSEFFIHIDKKSNFDNFLSMNEKNIHFTKQRVSVYWGDFSQVEAILILIRSAISHQQQFDRFVLLSGADYPLRSALYIERFFDRNPDKEFINCVAMPCDAAGKPIRRLIYYVPRPGNPLNFYVIRKALEKVGVLPHCRDYKKVLGSIVPYGGCTWWALSRNVCDFILRFVKEQVKIVSFFKNTVCPDESFFQTILGNSKFKPYIRRNLTYVDWSAGGPNPAYITQKHLESFKSSLFFCSDEVYGSGEMLFARKFTDDSEDLVNKLDKQITEKDNILIS
jgi:hypothetical protein